jgi:ATP-dependent exoDNAse (exonuclease V) beta subunit
VIERLSRESSVDADAISDAVRHVLKSATGSRVDGLDPEVITRRVQSLIESELWNEVRTAARCFREIDFLLGWPLGAATAARTAVIAGTLDCLLMSPGGEWKILDYKTGRLPDGDPAALRDHFAIQLVLYAEAVRAMTRQPPRAVEIVALNENLRRFPLVLWDDFRTSVHQRIDAAIRHWAASPDLGGCPDDIFALSDDGTATSV